jgi:hypothetical protein
MGGYGGLVGETALQKSSTRTRAARNARRIETPTLRAPTRLEPCLGKRRRGVLEDARADKRRCDPDRVQRRDERKLKSRNRCGDKRRGRRLMLRAGADQRHRAFMPGRFRVGMEQLVPMRQNAQRESREQRGASPARDGFAKERGGRGSELTSHLALPSPGCPLGARVFTSRSQLPHKRNKTRFVGARSRLLFLRGVETIEPLSRFRNLRVVTATRPRRLRTAWISDVHLGTRGSNAAALLEFLRDYEVETLYIVGDLIGTWQMRRGIYWPAA